MRLQWTITFTAILMAFSVFPRVGAQDKAIPDPVMNSWTDESVELAPGVRMLALPIRTALRAHVVELPFFDLTNEKPIEISHAQVEVMVHGPLTDMVYDGATDLSRLDLAALSDPGESHQAWFLFTDGLATLPGELPRLADAATYVFSCADRADHNLLSHLARKGGGTYFNLLTQRDDAILAALSGAVDGAATPTVLALRPGKPGGDNRNNTSGAEYATDLWPPSGTRMRLDEPLVLTGRLLADTAEVALDIVTGGKNPEMHTLTFTLDKKDAVLGGVVSRLWAQRRIAELSPLATRKEKELARRGKDCRSTRID